MTDNFKFAFYYRNQRGENMVKMWKCDVCGEIFADEDEEHPKFTVKVYRPKIRPYLIHTIDICEGCLIAAKIPKFGPAKIPSTEPSDR